MKMQQSKRKKIMMQNGLFSNMVPSLILIYPMSEKCTKIGSKIIQKWSLKKGAKIDQKEFANEPKISQQFHQMSQKTFVIILLALHI